MKPTQFLTSIFSFFSSCCFCQEFRTNSNGLMYSDHAMQQLKQMVADQNIKYKNCSLAKPYESHPQARAFTVSFASKSNNLQTVLSAIKNDMNFHELVAKFASLRGKTDTTGISVMVGKDEKGKPEYLYGDADSDGFDNDYIMETGKSANRWHYDYSTPDSYSKEYSLNARFIPGAFKHQEIPMRYSRLIQYVDCMIDTNARIYLGNNYSGGRFSSPDEKMEPALEQYILQKYKASGKRIDIKKEDYTDKLRGFASGELRSDTAFARLMKMAIAKNIKDQRADMWLESWAESMGDKKEALQLMRCRRVMGFCSQDESPRLHALAIATAAGEVQQWDIFMRAHMDIMNDRFERMSDGSYAWEARQTYLKELEELDLNTNDMMLGMTLRAANTSANHYNGTVWRLGKAMTESRDRANFEKMALTMITDPDLDAFNRGLVLLLLKTYIYRLRDVTAANSLIMGLKNDTRIKHDPYLFLSVQAMAPAKDTKGTMADH